MFDHRWKEGDILIVLNPGRTLSEREHSEIRDILGPLVGSVHKMTHDEIKEMTSFMEIVAARDEPLEDTP